MLAYLPFLVSANSLGVICLIIFLGSSIILTIPVFATRGAAQVVWTGVIGFALTVEIAVMILLVVLTYLLSRTSFGRHVYAVGGNTEAARRAGINVRGVKIACFIFCSTLAAVAGILFASRDNSISPSTGGSTTLLFAVAAAVIGGTSLFGGKGKISDAVIGGLVVGVIANGLPLITDQAGIQFIVTGLVLLVAASVDALSRRRAVAS